ncbi:Death-associated inhibitor of apoptosis 1 [Astathelohania contejeani]|uniref:Death-associated inhibitor of apoptosis 1 n=1 Tax=Astathelohania contejeani TaxID=164912 RepID=A0ABQ7HWW3_9MICR|nr:Death-associated inhibitor of apoptosis 1 [Thelohania contejeani]
MDSSITMRSKKFYSYDSLRQEHIRLETFIDWPIKWLKPEELAANGYYYLRTRDHCACVFCSGIVGEWMEGDIPSIEHKKHFPHCPLLNNQPVGNFPMNICKILLQFGLRIDTETEGKYIICLK